MKSNMSFLKTLTKTANEKWQITTIKAKVTDIRIKACEVVFDLFGDFSSYILTTFRNRMFTRINILTVYDIF